MANGAQSGGDDIGPAFQDAAVQAVFEGFTPEHRAALMALRALIFDVAAQTDGIGELVETLKWGQPAYLTAKPKTGSTIRLGVPKKGGFAMFTHCQSTLIKDFSEQFGTEFTFDGNRAVLFEDGASVPEDPMRILIAPALTYHKSKMGA